MSSGTATSETGAWVPAHLTDACPTCHASFFPASTLRRLRCRCCGALFCAPCASHRALLRRLSAASGRVLRVCSPCWASLSLPPLSTPSASAQLRACAPLKPLRALCSLIALEGGCAPTLQQHAYATALHAALSAALGLDEGGARAEAGLLLGAPPQWASDGKRAARVGAALPRVRAATVAGDAAEAGEPFLEALPPTARGRVLLLAACIAWLRGCEAYDARPRALLKGVAHRMGVAWVDVAVEEDLLDAGVAPEWGGGLEEASSEGSSRLQTADAASAAATVVTARSGAHKALVAAGAVLGTLTAVAVGIAAGGVALPLAGVAVGCKIAAGVALSVKVAGIGGGIAVVTKNTSAALRGREGDAALVVEPLSAVDQLTGMGEAAVREQLAKGGEQFVSHKVQGFSLTLGAAGPRFHNARSLKDGGGAPAPDTLLPLFVAPWGGYANCFDKCEHAVKDGRRQGELRGDVGGGGGSASSLPPAKLPSSQPTPPSAPAPALPLKGDLVSLKLAVAADEPLMLGWLRHGRGTGGEAYLSAFHSLPWFAWPNEELLPEAGAWLHGQHACPTSGCVFIISYRPHSESQRPIGWVAVGPTAPLPSRTHCESSLVSELRVCIAEERFWSDGARNLYIGSDALLTAVEGIRTIFPGRKFLWRPPITCVAALSMVNNYHAKGFPLCEGDQLRLSHPTAHYECVLSPSRSSIGIRRCYIAQMRDEEVEEEAAEGGGGLGEGKHFQKLPLLHSLLSSSPPLPCTLPHKSLTTLLRPPSLGPPLDRAGGGHATQPAGFVPSCLHPRFSLIFMQGCGNKRLRARVLGQKIMVLKGAGAATPRMALLQTLSAFLLMAWAALYPPPSVSCSSLAGLFLTLALAQMWGERRLRVGCLRAAEGGAAAAVQPRLLDTALEPALCFQPPFASAALPLRSQQSALLKRR